MLLYKRIILIECFSLAPHFLEYMSETETGLEMSRLRHQKRLIIYLRQIVVILLNMHIGTEIKGSQIPIVGVKNLSVFRKCIIPLLQIDISLSLQQMKM